MEGQQRPQAAGQPHQTSLIRAEQVARLPQLNDTQKQQYTLGVKRLWDILNSTPQTDQKYIEAYKKLDQTSQTLMQGMKNFQLQAKHRAMQQAAAQAAQQNARHGGAATGAAGQMSQSAAAFSSLSEEIKAKVNGLQFILPPQMTTGSKQAEDWVREAKARYGQALQRLTSAQGKKSELERHYQSRVSQGSPLNPQELESYNSRLGQCNKAITESTTFMEKFRNQQNEFRSKKPQHMFSRPPTALQQQQNAAAAGDASADQTGSAMTPHPQSAVMQGGNVTAHSIATAVSAAASARSQQAGATHPGPTVSSANNAGANAMQSHAASIKVEGAAAQPFNQLPPHSAVDPSSSGAGAGAAGVGAGAGAAGAHAAVAAAAAATATRPISHDGPVSAGGVHPQHHPSQAGMHAHPLNPNIGAKNGVPSLISKTMNITEPKPVPMPPSRPTLNAGPGVGLPGQLGQPAITTLPGYVLESSEDGKLLSRNKLHELAREVCGPGASEQMSPEAEEIFLMIADDFVDDLVTMASRLAKLHGSSTLEPRDLQMVLERHYNIRIPGYSTDEIRTAKRVQPAPGWAHKMSAVQAAKLTGGVGSTKD